MIMMLMMTSQDTVFKTEGGLEQQEVVKEVRFRNLHNTGRKTRGRLKVR